MTASVVSTLVSTGITALLTCLASYAVVLLSVFFLQDHYQCYHEANGQIARHLVASHAPIVLTTQRNEQIPPEGPTNMIHDIQEATQQSHQGVTEEQQQIPECHNQEESRAPQDPGTSEVSTDSMIPHDDETPHASTTSVVHDLLEDVQRSHQGVTEEDLEEEQRTKALFLALPGEDLYASDAPTQSTNQHDYSASKTVAMRLNFRNDVRNCVLDRTSNRAVRRCLDQRMLSRFYFDFNNFLRMTEEIVGLTLFGRIVVPPEVPGMKTKVHETEFWVDQSVYPRHVGQSQCYEYI